LVDAISELKDLVAEPTIARHPTTENLECATKRSADIFLKQNRVQEMHELLLQQLVRTETLMKDNALLQRTIYKYEEGLSELGKPASSNKELKRLCES
jgi:hypothetical protein